MKAKFKIVPFTNPGGGEVFRLDAMVPGRAVDKPEREWVRVRENYPTSQEAIGRKQVLEARAANIEVLPMVQTRLTRAQVLEAEACFQRLGGKHPLMSAVEWFLKNFREPVTQSTLKDAFEQFKKDKLAENSRPATMRNLEQRIGCFVTFAGEKTLVSDVLPEHINEFIQRKNGHTRGPRSKRNDRLALSSFFNWATKQRQYCAANPVERSLNIKVETGEPKIISLADVRKLLVAAQSYNSGRYVPYVALGLFCAIRPRELQRLSWANVDLKNKIVTIPASVAKTRSRRTVSISDNCLEWLEPYALKHQPIGANVQAFRQVREKAGLLVWEPDTMRHTGISMHLAEHDNEGKTASWAGNSPNIIHKFYKGLIGNPDDVKEFWSIAPGNIGQIISLPKAKVA